MNEVIIQKGRQQNCTTDIIEEQLLEASFPAANEKEPSVANRPMTELITQSEGSNHEKGTAIEQLPQLPP